jgi:hypothetical protein
MTRMFVMDPPGNSMIQLQSQERLVQVAGKAVKTVDSFISEGS